MNEFVSCIVAAGGSGSRMGADKNKLLLEIGGIPVLCHTLAVLQDSENIAEIIISAREEEIIEIAHLAEKFGITKLKSIVKGGKTRTESVMSAVKEISDKCELVMVHDGARPFVTEKIISDTISAAKEFSAAACGVKPKCTLKSVENGFITETVDREMTVEIQTPQVFSKELFLKMYQKDSVTDATDDCILAERCGAKIFVTEGSYKNIKITTPEDMEIAESFIRRS